MLKHSVVLEGTTKSFDISYSFYIIFSVIFDQKAIDYSNYNKWISVILQEVRAEALNCEGL